MSGFEAYGSDGLEELQNRGLQGSYLGTRLWKILTPYLPLE